MATVALVWAATLAPAVIQGGMLRDLAKSMGPGADAEEAPEFLGLCIAAAWMAALSVATRGAPRDRGPRRS